MSPQCWTCACQRQNPGFSRCSPKIAEVDWKEDDEGVMITKEMVEQDNDCDNNKLSIHCNFDINS